MRHRAFTIVEILVVMAIISVLAAIIFAVLGPVRESARQRSCASNLHQIGLAVAMYAADYDGQEPIKDSSTTYAKVGLPDGSTSTEAFIKNYLKVEADNKNAPLACPTWSRSDQKLLGYFWLLFDGDNPDIEVNKILSLRGPEYPLVYCENHNAVQNFDELPRWEQKRILVLRVSQKIDNKLYLVHDRSPFWY